MCVCVRFSSRYIFLFYCYLSHARRLSTLFFDSKREKKYKINKYCIMCLYMQTTEKNEEERIDVCLVRPRENPLPSSDRFSTHVPKQW